MNVDDLDWSDDDEEGVFSPLEEDDVPKPASNLVYVETEHNATPKKSNFFSGQVKLKSKNDPERKYENHNQSSFNSSIAQTRQNTVTSGLTLDNLTSSKGGLSLHNIAKSQAASFRSDIASPQYFKQNSFNSVASGTNSVFSAAGTVSTAIPPLLLRFYGEDIVAEMWEILLSLDAVDTVSSLVKIMAIRDLVKWLRQIKGRQPKHINVNEKTLWKELNKWDADDWVSFSEIIQIIQRHSTVETTAAFQAPTATKNAAAAKIAYSQFKEPQHSLSTFHKPVLLNRCCAHAACRVVCAYAYTNTVVGNLGHNGSTSIATADGMFHLDFIAPLFNKQRSKTRNPSLAHQEEENELKIHIVQDSSVHSKGKSDSSQAATESNNGDNINDKEEEEQDAFSRRDLFRLNVAFSRVMVKRPGGRLRVEDLLEVMKEAGIAYDLSKVAIESWDIAKHLLVESLESVLPLLSRLKKEEELITGPLAHLIQYPVPLWLQQEFSQAEILLYQHHFMLIDVDGGGSIDAGELQQLLNSFCGEGTPGGYRVTVEEAGDIVNMFDLDGGGTLDFVEFLVLIYRLQQGTMSREFLTSRAGSVLVKALTEAKRQLHLFEEIEEVGLHPPEGCEIVSFGGSPVLCVVSITIHPKASNPKVDTSSPESVSSSEGSSQLIMHVTMHDGYPYRPPDVLLKEPGFIHPLCIRALDGSCRLLHLNRLWQGLERLTDEEREEMQLQSLLDDVYIHDLESLLRHVYTLLNQSTPIWTRTRCIDWLPTELREIYHSWQWTWEQLKAKRVDNAGAPTADSAPSEEQKASKCPLYTAEALSDEVTMRKLQRLPRLQQMHLGTLLVYLQDPNQYQALAHSILQFKRVLDL